MNDEQRYAVAYQLTIDGKNLQACVLLERLMDNAKPLVVQYRAISLFLDVAQNCSDEQLLHFCSKGLALAEKLNKPEGMVFFALKKASYQTALVGFEIGNLKKLTGVHGWIGFALSRDEDLYHGLRQRERERKDEVSKLLNIADRIEPSITDVRQLAFNQHYRAVIFGHQALNGQAEFLSPKKVDYLLARLGIPMLFKYSCQAHQYIWTQRTACIKAQCMAEKLFLEANDKKNAAMSAYNVANWSLTFRRFWRATRHLKRAEPAATELGMQDLLKKINVLKKSIRLRNKDLPNYRRRENRHDFK